MHQATMDFSFLAPGASGYYAVSVAGVSSAVFEVVPTLTRPEVHVVFGDFGLANDVSMAALVADAAAGAFDSVLHVGDWACESLRQVNWPVHLLLATGKKPKAPARFSRACEKLCASNTSLSQALATLSPLFPARAQTTSRRPLAAAQRAAWATTS